MKRRDIYNLLLLFNKYTRGRSFWEEFWTCRQGNFCSFRKCACDYMSVHIDNDSMKIMPMLMLVTPGPAAGKPTSTYHLRSTAVCFWIGLAGAGSDPLTGIDGDLTSYPFPDRRRTYLYLTQTQTVDIWRRNFSKLWQRRMYLQRFIPGYVSERNGNSK